jgi:hypothetical protein
VSPHERDSAAGLLELAKVVIPKIRVIPGEKMVVPRAMHKPNDVPAAVAGRVIDSKLK